LTQNRLARQRRTQAERRDEAERRILDAAIRLVVERGYNGFSLAEVGELAGYSRGLPGHYFAKKEDLLSQVALFLISNYHEATAEAEASLEPGLPRLVARIRRYIHGFGSRGNKALSVIIAEARFQPKLKRTITDLNLRARARWTAEVQAGIEAGNIRPDTDAEATGSMIHAFLRGQSTFVDLDPSYDTPKATEALVASLLYLCAPQLAPTPIKGGRRPV
jgi:AcrR family transcriptional regulator